MAAWSKVKSVRPFACWDCGFESHRGHACLLWVLCVVRQRSLRRANHSSRGVLQTVVHRVSDLKTSWMRRPWHNGDWCAKQIKNTQNRCWECTPGFNPRAVNKGFIVKKWVPGQIFSKNSGSVQISLPILRRTDLLSYSNTSAPLNTAQDSVITPLLQLALIMTRNPSSGMWHRHKSLEIKTRLHILTFRETVFLIVTAVRISHLTYGKDKTVRIKTPRSLKMLHA